MAKKKDESEAITKGHFVRCRYCGQKNSVKADYKNGTLTITLPKKEIAKPRQVKVQVSSN